MKRITLVALALTALSACGGGSTSESAAANALLSPATSAPAGLPTRTVAAPDANFASLLNDMRIDNGAGVVTHNGLLDLAAQSHAQDMLTNNYFSHTGLNGSDLRDRVNATGYDWSALGENLGSGQQTDQDIMDGWTNSPGHHANNINPVFEEFGLGVVRDGSRTRWVLVLGTPR